MDSSDAPVDAEAAIDAATAEWRQGDCVVGGDCWFIHRASQDDKDAIRETPVEGFVVVSQTCDVVRGCGKRPFVDVCPLVKMEADSMPAVRAGKLPQYAFVPALANKRLVADLDRTMSVEKRVLARWTRVQGWKTDDEVRAFADCLRRKCSRFAFPNDFSAMCGKFQDRMKDKHKRDSDEGMALRALREIRVTASPEWDAEQVGLTFWFIKGCDPEFKENENWVSLLKKWLDLLPATGRFTRVDGQVTTLTDMTAEEYVSSDVLDLERLSVQTGK